MWLRCHIPLRAIASAVTHTGTCTHARAHAHGSASSLEEPADADVAADHCRAVQEDAHGQFDSCEVII